MKTKAFMAMAVLALVAMGCNNDETDNWNGEIRLTSGLEVQTRTSHNLDMFLKTGELVHVWVDDAGNVANTELYKDKELTARDNGFLTGETMYFPQTGNAVNIYAIHGNFGEDTDWTGSGFWGEKIMHKVEQNQKTGQETDGYAKSDLVYAQSTNVARTKEDINLQFKHLLSKVEVVLVKGAGSPDIEKMEILNTKLEAVFTPSKENEFEVTENGSDGENPIETDTHLTEKAAAESTDNDDDKELNEAIIVPQELAQGTAFIRVTTDEGGTLIYRLPEQKTFEPAKKYRFTVTANLTELKVVSAKITDWTKETGDDNGTAEME